MIRYVSANKPRHGLIRRAVVVDHLIEPRLLSCDRMWNAGVSDLVQEQIPARVPRDTVPLSFCLGLNVLRTEDS